MPQALRRRIQAFAAAVAVATAPSSFAATVVVTTAGGLATDGQCSFIEAITAVNNGSSFFDCANSGASAWGAADTITFAIPGGGPHVIAAPALGGFPQIDKPVTIDGFSQAGASPNTNGAATYPNAQAINAVIQIELDGTAWGSSGLVLSATAGGSTVRGLSVVNFKTGTGIQVQGQNVVVGGNFIGVRADGVTAAGNRLGVSVYRNDMVGFPSTPSLRNLIAGNLNVDVSTSLIGAGNVISSNLIGTDRSGAAVLSGGACQANVLVLGASEEVDSNVVGGCHQAAEIGIGVFLYGGQNASVHGNSIGVGVGGAAIGGDFGIQITNHPSQATTGNAVYGNGIANSAHDGINVSDQNGFPSGNRLDGNAIWNSGGIGINLMVAGEGASAVTPNDPPASLDADTGPNGLQNFPVIGTATVNGSGGVDIAFTLDSAATRTYRISAYASDSCNPSGYGEGRFYSGTSPNYSTDAAGHLFVTRTIPAPLPSGWSAGKYVTLLAHDTVANNTSEFSACVAITSSGPAPAPVASPAPSSLAFGSQTVGTASATQTVTVTNTGNAALTIGALAVTLTGANPGDFAVTAGSCAGASVAPAGACTVTLRFAPLTAGARSASLSIASNDPASPLVVPLSGTGGQASPTDVPTMTGWGLALFGLAVALGGMRLVGRTGG